MIVQLDKALYGCMESSKLWYDHLRKTLESLGFAVNPHDICVFNKGEVKDGTQCTIALHVDDLMITCKNKAIIDMVVADIIGVYKDVAVRRGTVHPYLGMTFDFSKDGKVQVSMDGYVTDLLEHLEVRGKAKTQQRQTYSRQTKRR